MRQIGVAIAFIVMLSGCQVSPGHGNTFSSSINGTGGQLYISPARTISGPATGITANAVNGLAIDFTR
jgi:hypothetical protein